jgi:hypothetical protein
METKEQLTSGVPPWVFPVIQVVCRMRARPKSQICVERAFRQVVHKKENHEFIKLQHRLMESCPIGGAGQASTLTPQE